MSELVFPQGEQTAPPRSFHFIPATLLQHMDTPRLETIGADTLVFDLEDSVRPEDKDQARDWLAAYIDTKQVPKGIDFYVRLNMPSSEWWDSDFQVFDGRVPLMIPRISSIKDIPANTESDIIPLLETVEATELVPGLAAMTDAAGRPKIRTVLFGKEDLSAELGHINTDPDSTNPMPSTDLRVNVAMRGLFSYVRWGMSHDLHVYDGVTKYLGGRGEASRQDLEAESAYARQIGAVGKLSIHPSQVATINEVFDPSRTVTVEPQSGVKPDLTQDTSNIPNRDAKLRNAERIIQVFERNQRAQITAALEIDGAQIMVGPPAYRLAQAILAAQA